jgi:heme o synthase
MKSAVSVSIPVATSTNWRDYLVLTKPTISMLVVVTALPSMLMGAHSIPTFEKLFSVLFGTWLASGSAAVFNHLIEQDSDHLMGRTNRRPLPAGRISTVAASLFAITLGVISTVMLYFGASPLSALLAVAANFFYVVVYTLFLKRRTDQNIVIGGAAGAVGPLIGWAAVSDHLGVVPWLLFLLIFLWTPPHFWSLALKYKEDYRSANIPMLPVTRGDTVTRKQILWYSLSLLPVVLAIAWLQGAGFFFWIVGTAMTLWLVWLAIVLNQLRTEAAAMRLFHVSCIYLLALFACLALDQLFIV